MSRLFPQVIVTTGAVDASDNVIVVNPDDATIMRGHQYVAYGVLSGKPTRAFRFARLMLERAPNHVHSRALLAAMFGDDEQHWPADRASAVGAGASDLRHRAATKLGLVLMRSGHSSYALIDEKEARLRRRPVRDDEIKVAEGSRRGNGTRTSDKRRFGIELSPEDAAAITAVAQEFRMSFSEAARTVIAWGLESQERDAA